MLNSANMTEAGPLSMLSEDEGDMDSDNETADIKLPGVRKGGCDWWVWPVLPPVQSTYCTL